jgi:hypothetical protein
VCAHGSDLKRLARGHGYKYLLCILDTTTKTLSPKEVIPILKAVFEAHIVPDLLQSDNGGQFVSDLMKEFEQTTQFRHLTGSYRSKF